MSALAKPFIHSTSTIDGVVDPVNVENISSFSKIDVPASASNNNKSLYALQFAMRDNGVGTPNSVLWKYPTDTARDSDYTTLIALVSNAI